MKYDGVGVSSADLSLGTSFFRSKPVQNFPFLSANVLGSDGKLFFRPSIMLKRSGLRVGLIGLTDTAVQAPEGLQIVDWRKPLSTRLHALKPQCEIVIVLSSLSPDENRELAQNFAEVSVIVTAYPGASNRPPEQLNQTLLTSVKARGKYLGKLDIVYRGGKGWLQQQRGIRPDELRKRITIAKHRLNALKTTATDNAQSQRIKEQKIKRLQAHVRSLQSRLELLLNQLAKSVANSFESTFRAIPPVQEEAEVDRIVSEIRSSIKAYGISRNSTIPAKEHNLSKLLQLKDYAGSQRCKDCHIEQFNAWQKSAHSKAYTTLIEHGQEYNPDCLVCHVTRGNIRETSQDSRKSLLISLPENRRHVGCETCHGPAASHTSHPDQFLPVRTPPEESCITCHTPRRDKDFSYDRKLQLMKCSAP